MTNLRDHVKAWLESIGADGLMMPDKSIELIKADLPQNSWFYLVPAYRHADGTYHVEPELTKPCDSCWKEDCISEMAESCQVYMKWKKRWLAHKGEEK
jgi:hypothetical protein